MKTGRTPDEAWIFDRGGGLGGEWPLSIVLDDQGRIVVGTAIESGSKTEKRPQTKPLRTKHYAKNSRW